MVQELPKLSVLNRYPKVLSGPQYLHHLVCESSPTNEPAIDFLENGVKRRKLAYEALHAASDALAKSIVASLARLENASAVVPVLLPQSPELYVALLAILKAGKAFCPIGLDAPPERIAFILQDISADILITITSLRDRLPAHSGAQVLLVDSVKVTHPHSAGPGTLNQRQTNLAYVLYTSGSTGLPKAVSVSHRAVTQSLLAHERHIPPFSRFLQFAAPTFDVSIFEIFFPLFRGCTLVGCTRTNMLNDLPATITSLQVDAAELTPTVVSNLLRGRRSVPGLRLLLTIGEMLTRDVVDEYGGSENQPSMLWGMYGPTEAAIHCTLQPSFSCTYSLGNIGYPLDTVTVMIAAPLSKSASAQQLEILPRGEVGELVIGGSQVADEYLNRPETTSASFFHDQEYGYLYRTGDKARLFSDGTLECLGRMASGQVKLRGQRVELGEIEQTIMKVNNCHSAVALVIEDTLVAFCAAEPGALSRNNVKEHCRQWLPNYMVPTDVVFIDRMPQLPSGKVDKQVLEANYLNAQRRLSSPEPQSNGKPNGSIDSILRETLGREITENEDFASTGLDSLRSIRIASHLRQNGYEIAPLDILATNSLKELKDLCQKHKTRPHNGTTDFGVDANIVSKIAELQPYSNDISIVLPCTPLQDAMLTETAIRPSAYCNWIEVELFEQYSFARLREALEILVQQNEILRTGFYVANMAPASFLQIVWKRVQTDAVREVSTFSKAYSLGSVQSLLRPLDVQVNTTEGRSRLLFQIHHALYDGWSFDLLLRDLNELLEGRSGTIRPQFREVVDYFLENSHASKLEDAADYWRKTLSNYHPAPVPNLNGNTFGYSGLRSLRGQYAIDTESLFSGARAHSIHPQVFYQAATAYVLGQYLGSSDVVIGTVTSGRTIPVTHIEEILGPCIATLPFRVDLSCSYVSELLHKMQQANRDMLQHSALPLRDIKKLGQLRPEERLFDVLFVWQESLISADNRKLALRTVDSADDSEFKITVEVEPRDDDIAYRITYDPATIPEKQVELLARQIQHTVQYFLSNWNGYLQESKRCLDLDLVSIDNVRPEMKSILHGPAHSVEDWAVKAPNKDAIILGSMVDGSMRIMKSLSYALLNARANQLAHALVVHEVGNGQLVCIMLDKSIDLYVSILAVLKTGCGYLPIVPDTPTERVNRILADAGVKVCISNSESCKDIRQHGLVILDPAVLERTEYPEHNLAVPYNGDHLGYAVYTSGSTGKPKGVLVTQNNLMSNLEYLSTLYPYDENSRLLQSCSQAFDVSVFEIFFSWYVGICLCTATKDDLFYDFEAAIDSLGATHLSLTPTVAGLVEPSKVPKVQFLITAGEALTETVKRKWAGKGLYQGYGPSETTNICTVKPCVTGADLINNIGPVFPNTSLLIFEPGSDRIVPRGAVGELCFGGAQVFRGYLNEPGLNAEKLFDHSTYGRIYRSGDMGRLLPNGDILSTGRLDDQVKIRGQRVEPGEITAAVLNHLSVQDCATVLVNDQPSQKLVVFWVPKDTIIPVLTQEPPSNARSAGFRALASGVFRPHVLEILESLSLQLPAYMIPTHAIPIRSIPMTPQGKIDKKKLRNTFDNLKNEELELTSLGFGVEPDDVKLSTAEQTIAEALSRTLRLPPADIKRRSSFFNLGLDSVSAIRFAKDLREAGFGHLPVSQIFKNPTVERLSSVLGKASASKYSRKESIDVFSSEHLSRIRFEIASKDLEVDRILPCTPLQEAMLSASSSSHPKLNQDAQHSVRKSSYYNVMAFTVHGNLARLKKSWEKMVERHDILRTTFVSTESAQYAYAQVIFKDVPVAWDELESSTNVGDYAGQVLPGLLQSHKPPVCLAIQGHLSSARLIFCCHHALYDGVAITTLLDEVQRVYLEELLPPPAPYEIFLQHMMLSNREEDFRFWTGALADFEPTYFPSLSSQVLPSSLQATGSVRRILQPTLGKVLSQCRVMSCSLLSVVQAAWAKVLHFVLAESDLCFGNVVSGRTLPEDGLDRLVAPCFNTLPMRLKFDFQSPNIELCKKLHSLNVDVLPFQLTPLRWIQSKTRHEQGRLFDTLVILQRPSTSLDETIWSLESDDGQMDLPMVCEVVQNQSSNRLELKLQYQRNLCQEFDAEVLATIFDNALQQVVRFPSVAANDTFGFPSHILGQSNMKVRTFDPPSGGLLHSAFEQNAIERPDAVALDFRQSDRSATILTFNALNERANQVAHSLLQHDVKPEDVIPVHMPKCPEFYISILGVLKAGAAFSPIHPGLPEARKRFMVSELKPKVILSGDDAVPWFEGVVVVNVTNTEHYPTVNPLVSGLRPTNIVYCLYTSGSTGVPKAVSMEHRSPIQTIESSRSLIPWDHSSRLLQYAAITFDMCYYDCFLSWTFGFTLCSADQDTMLNDLTGSISALKVDLLDLTPSVANSLKRIEVPSVKWLYCIGEAMTTEVVQEWAGACVNSYGPTEAAFCTTIFPTAPEIKTSVIGRPFPTTSFAVFSPQGKRLVPAFGVGELYIGGAQLARGYHGQTQLTEEKFLHKYGQRFYKSGDVVRMLADGNFEFLGRTDDQVKIRGLRVELGEINTTLKDSDEFIAAVTTQILKKDDKQKDQLVTFLVTRHPADNVEQAKLRLAVEQNAKNNLPSYMVPQFFLFIDKIPKSLAGKEDKKALTSIFRESTEDAGLGDAGEGTANYQWSERENCIRDVFAKLSGTPPGDIKSSTTIHQLGLDSISAVQVAAALRKQGLQANATDVMRYMNCKDIAAHLERSSEPRRLTVEGFDFEAFDRKNRTEAESICAATGKQLEAIRPCTPLQNGMLSQFIAKEGGLYFNYLRLHLVDGIDQDRLKDAWQATVQKHRMLRTGFAHVKDGNTSFAMLHYAQETVLSNWQESQAHPCPTEDWLRESAQEAAKHLHLPPWRVRVNKLGKTICLDLAILHALFDAQSLQLLFYDIVASYNGNAIVAAPLDPIIETILHLSKDEKATSESFWKQLGKIAAPTRSPNVSPRRYDAALPSVLVKSSTRTLEELNAGCRASNISLQSAGLASWASLLSAYVGESAVTFGVVLSGRNFDGAEAAVFPCITTVPFACNVSDRQDELLGEVMSLNAEIQQHQFTPLNRIQKLMGYPNEPLFDSIFAFQKFASEDEKDAPWAVVDERATIEYPLSIELEPKDGRLDFRLTFLPHVIPKEQASLILDQLDFLLQQFIFPRSDTQAFQPELYSITPANTPTIPSEVKLLHELLEHTAAQYPDRIAFEFATSLQLGAYKSRKWTYAELDGEGNRIANLLISQGVQPGGLVGVCFDKCPEASFAILGILKAGCAFVALDPGAPSARKAFILQDSGAPVALSMATQSANFKENTKSLVLNLDEVDWQSTSPKKPTLQRDIGPQDRSYCLYTSGTTGTPKGCELTHENAVQAMLAFKRLFSGHWDDKSRWLQFASFHFDVSVLEQYWSWSVGICVVSAPRDLIFEDIAASIRTLQITHIDLTPSLARILHPHDVPTLCKGVFITGGESLTQEILDVWGPKSVIYNGYGPTEATIGCTMYPRVPANGKPSNIGPQFDNVGSYVLRPGTDIPVLRGGVGELCVSGKLVGKGYLNRPDLTKERFAQLDRFNERVYRTGDLVRILHDGTFDFLGRADDQVKLRGQRLEIGEINSVIKQCGITVADVATLVLKHPKQQKEQLVSFIVVGSGTRGEPKILLEKVRDLWKVKEACQEKLPPYMVPTHFVALTTMPLSANNKAEVRKLKEMYEALSVNELQLLSSGTQAKDDKWTIQEERIRDVFRDALSITENDFSKDASFFELGMDSISVIGVSRALKQAGFLKAAASVLLRHATVRRLTKALSDKSFAADDQGSVISAQQAITAVQHRHRRTVAETLFMDSRNVEALAPCTPLQQGMIARSLESEHGLYFNSFRFELRKDVDITKLRGAWHEVFSSIQILRTVFVNTDDGFVQAALRQAELSFEEFTLSPDDDIEDYLGKRRENLVQLNRTHIKRPLEVLVVETPKSGLLVLHIFHGLYDGNSINLVFKAVWDAYNDRKIESGPAFHSALAYGPLRPTVEAKQFWEQHLADHHFKLLPTIAERGSDGPVVFTREIQDLVDLDETRRKLNVTAQAIAQACWTGVLHQYLGTTITLGMVVSGRSIDFEGADKVIGPLFNTIPYQYHAKSRETWSSLVKKTHEFNVAAQPYQHTPLRDIMKWMKRGPNQPLFDALFVYQVAGGDEEWTKNELWTLQDSGADADYPLAIEVEQSCSRALILTLVAQSHAMDLEMATQLLERYEEALREAIEKPDTAVETFVTGDEEDTTGRIISMKPNSSNITDIMENFKWSSHATTIREEVAELSGVEVKQVAPNTSIFELGLDSIDAIKLSSKLKKHGIELPVSGIMRNLNIANMVQHISVGNGKKDGRSSDMIYKANKKRLESYLKRRGLIEGLEQVLPLTPLQDAMVAEMIASEYTRYYNHDVLELQSGVDIELLKEAWTEVVKKSPILRTSFVPVDDPGIDFSHAQVVHYEPHDFWRSTQLDREPKFPLIFDDIKEEMIARGSSQPLFHVRLIQSPQKTYLVLSIAHALYDGWSLGLLHSDVYQAYVGTFQPRPSYEPALHEILTTSGADAAAFWRDYLSGAKPAHFPSRPSASPQSVHRKQRSSHVYLSVITSFAKKHNITLQTLGQTVHGATIASYTKSLDVTFGSVLSGRDDETRAQLLFPTMNTVAIRTVLHGTRREMLQYVQDNFSSIAQWQHFPLRKALALAGAQGSLLQSLFIYQKSLDNEGEESEKLYESIQGRSDVEYPVCVEMEVVGDELVWRCAVKEEGFNEEGAKELLARLDSALEAIVTQPDAGVIDFAADGTSVCGLPAFVNDVVESMEQADSKAVQQGAERSASPTAGIIREVLTFVSQTPEDEITAGMTIFHIGLDSISAIKVASLLRKRGIILSVGEMLRVGTVEGMARIVAEREPDAGSEDDNIDAVLEGILSGIDRAAVLNGAGIKEADVESILPATAGQTYMLSMWLNSQGNMFYPEFDYRIEGTVSFEAIQQAWTMVVTQNAILRTSFFATNKEHTTYVQVTMRNIDASVTNFTGHADEGLVNLKAQTTAKQPYVHLFVSRSATSAPWDMKLKIHHALYDGVSLPLLIQQLQDLCNNLKASVPHDVLSKFITATSTSSALEQRKSFWTSYLKDLPQQHRLTQPISPPTTRTEIFTPALIPNISAIESRVHAHGLTTHAVFVATYAKLYAALTRTPPAHDVVLGIYLANRSLPLPNIHVAPIPTVNLVPLRVASPLQRDIYEVAAQIQYDLQELSAPTNATVGLWEVREWTGVTVDTFVNFLKLPGEERGEGKADSDSSIRITPVEKWGEPVGRIFEVDGGIRVPMEGLVDEKLNRAYMYALDIEATVRDGKLDAGVFAPGEMLGVEEGGRLIVGFREELEGLVG
ncbi:hypothetical protein BU23DRAFT_564003 [Bimuria novae-zelandiae CBS 107.79]|uniref:Carrier domain-containing protein n=1 Tax=Bimuria novae-zelandiae CBS 107.79 TaxID=1447943 RepID=A0A6A5VRS4_9PLEO|nr:hypothetical protein BU23DRAFT_564003 [Bimuria novae-zelandiae CBS 107.79]